MENLKELYWKNGNIFVFNTGDVRVVLGTHLINNKDFIDTENITDNLQIPYSLFKEKVIKVYSPNHKATNTSEITDTKNSILLWKRGTSKKITLEIESIVLLKTLNQLKEENKYSGESISKNNYIYAIIPDMFKYLGNVFKIINICKENDGKTYYKLENSYNENYLFPDYCIEGKVIKL